MRPRFIPELLRNTVVPLHHRRVRCQLEVTIAERPKIITEDEDASGEERMIMEKARG
jgi:hypothetical protein